MLAIKENLGKCTINGVTGTFCTVTCPVCSNDFTAHIGNVRARKTTKCKSCAAKIANRDRVLNAASTFVDKANIKHNNKFSYDKVNYINARVHVIVTCPEHGDWNITPDNHLRGYGCKKCFMDTNSFSARHCSDRPTRFYIIRILVHSL